MSGSQLAPNSTWSWSDAWYLLYCRKPIQEVWRRAEVENCCPAAFKTQRNLLQINYSSTEALPNTNTVCLPPLALARLACLYSHFTIHACLWRLSLCLKALMIFSHAAAAGMSIISLFPPAPPSPVSLRKLVEHTASAKSLIGKLQPNIESLD